MNDIDRVSKLCKQDHYDVIIVGSGLAGGILTRRLIERNKRVLLIEKGGLAFTTHCLNTSRPHWQIGSLEGPSQDNDVVYQAVKQKVQTAAGSDPYAGGPVYCLGGRSNVWGLYSPRIIKKVHQEFFPNNISSYLEEEGYDRALRLFSNQSQDANNIYPQGVISATKVAEAQGDLIRAIRQFFTNWGHSTQYVTAALAPMAAEFGSDKPYNFPQGAYSTVDFLLDCAYARNSNLTILLNTEVLYLSSDVNAKTQTLAVRSSSGGGLYNLSAKKIILSAGTLGTATIGLNSGLQKESNLVGKGLTDHEIWGVRFLREKNADDLLNDPIKFQSRLVIGKKDDVEHPDALLNVAINANSFLARDFCPSQLIRRNGELCNVTNLDPTRYDTVNVTIENRADLSEENEVLNIPSPEPVVRIKHTINDKTKYEKGQQRMQDLATQIRNVLLECSPSEPAPRLSRAGFGAVAHEVGTMRIKGPKTDQSYVVDEGLRVQGFNNLYVCDLSIFPFSPPANPSLTLAAIALWLADRL